MKTAKVDLATNRILRNPALAKLAETAARFTGVGLIAVLPDKEGGQQLSLCGRVEHPLFCRMIQSTREGAKHCKICHILMAVAASCEGVNERRCHAGLSTLVSPATTVQGEKLAVISTCMFVAGDREQTWKQARERGFQFKLDLKRLREAFDALPEISQDKLELASSIMAVVAETLAEIEGRNKAEEKLAALHTPTEPKIQIQGALRQALNSSRPTAPLKQARSSAAMHNKHCPILIRVVSNLITTRPNMPYSVAAIAAAARLTPSHFSALFHRWTGQTFMKFLNSERIAAAKRLLRDPTLSISEIAYRIGYEDASYFTRRFKQATHSTPQQWRNHLPVQ